MGVTGSPLEKLASRKFSFQSVKKIPLFEDRRWNYDLDDKDSWRSSLEFLALKGNFAKGIPLGLANFSQGLIFLLPFFIQGKKEGPAGEAKCWKNI
jgi:hypothetical protein